MARAILVPIIGFITALVSASAVLAQPADPSVVFEKASPHDVLDALYAECYDAGMFVEAKSELIIVCSTDLETTAAPGSAVAGVHGGRTRHRVRFALAERRQGIRVWAYPWIEIEEPNGTVLEEPIVVEEYLTRVQSVLDDAAESVGAGEEPEARPWADYYASEDEWRLDAHLEAVASCDDRMDSLTREQLERELEIAGFQPFGKDLRSRCEELYQEVFAWGLARGIDEPSVQAFAEHRATLPPEERVCSGRLALETNCGGAPEQ